jgi:hypothetical protein
MPSCGGEMKVIAFIIDHQVVKKIVRHLIGDQAQRERGPPQGSGPTAAS